MATAPWFARVLRRSMSSPVERFTGFLFTQVQRTDHPVLKHQRNHEAGMKRVEVCGAGFGNRPVFRVLEDVIFRYFPFLTFNNCMRLSSRFKNNLLNFCALVSVRDTRPGTLPQPDIRA